MKLRINEELINHNERNKGIILKNSRTKIKSSNDSIAKRLLFKIKHVENDILFGDQSNNNGHYVITVGVNPESLETAVAQLNSIEDSDGNPIKTNRIDKGFIKPINDNMIRGNSRKTGISIDVYARNRRTNQKLNYNDLSELNNPIEISQQIEKEIADFIFDNHSHVKISNDNKSKVANMKKIK